MKARGHETAKATEHETANGTVHEMANKTVHKMAKGATAKARGAQDGKRCYSKSKGCTRWQK